MEEHNEGNEPKRPLSAEEEKWQRVLSEYMPDELKLMATAEKRRQRDLRRKARESVDPGTSATFLNAIGVIMIVIGIVAAFVGVVAAIQHASATFFFAALAVALQCFWLAALTFIITGIARNMFRIAGRVDEMSARERGNADEPDSADPQ